MRFMVFFLSAIGLYALAAEETLTYQQGVNGYAGCMDTYVVMSTDSTPADATTLIVEGYHCSACIDQRTLIRYDLTALDKNVTITKAELMVYSPRQPRPGPGTVRAYKISRAWTPAEANWFNATQSIRWSKAGADFDTVAQATLTYTTQVNVWHTLDVTNLVKNFVANPETNFGMLLKLDPAMYTVAYVSSEGATTSQRPKLVITYSNAAVKNNLKPMNTLHAVMTRPMGIGLLLSFPDNGINQVRMESLDGSTVFNRSIHGPDYFIETRNFPAGSYGIVSQGHSGTLRNFFVLSR
jgi:hypothetical protein